MEKARVEMEERGGINKGTRRVGRRYIEDAAGTTISCNVVYENIRSGYVLNIALFIQRS